MARRPEKLVRHFKTQAAPAGARGHGPQAATQAIAERAATEAVHPMYDTESVTYGYSAFDDPTVPRPAAHYGTLETPVARPAVNAAVDAYVPLPAATQTPRTMGTPALSPDWYPETPNRIWSPQPQPTTDPRLRRNTGEGDLPTNLPYVNRPTTTTTPQKPTSPYTQPNVGVDITPEQFTPPPQQRIIQERPTTIDYGPITTPIARPVQEEAGNIYPQQPIDLTPGPQITATDTSLYEPQPVESAYALPVQVDYPQPTADDLNPIVEPDEVTDLIDTVIPDLLEAKTINIPQEGPQWVEDPYTLAAQEAIDEVPFDQTDPSIYQPQPTIDESPEIAYTQPEQEDPFVIDQAPQVIYQGNLTDWDAYTQPAQVDTQDFEAVNENIDETVQQPPITLPPELGMPEIPTTAATTTGGNSDDQDIWFVEGDTDGLQSGAGNTEWTYDTKVADTGLQPGIIRERLVGDKGEGTAKGLGPVITEGGLIVGERPESGIIDTDIVETSESVIPAKTITPSGEVIDDLGETYTVDTEAGVDIEQLPEGPIAGEVAEGSMIDSTEATVEGLEPFTPEIADPPDPVTVEDEVEGGVDVEVDQGDKVDPNVQQKALTTTGTGGRKWVHTGSGDFAETLHHFKTNRGSSGPPIVTDTPAVSGPVVNRETGEITTEPLTWWQFNPAGGSVSPYDATVGGTKGTKGTKGDVEIGTKPEPFPSPRNLHQNDWTSSVTSTASVQNFIDEASRADVPIVQFDGSGQPLIDFNNSTWSIASNAGVDTQSLGKANFKDADGTTKNAFEAGINFVSKGIKGITNLVFGNANDQSAKDLASDLGKEETVSLGKRINALWKEYALAWETDDVDPNNMRNILNPGEVQKKGDLQTMFVYNLLSGNIPAALGQLGASLSHKIFTDFRKGIKNAFDSDVIQGVTNGVMDTFKFIGNKAGKFLGFDAFNKKVESKGFETQEMQDWEKTYGEDAKGKTEFSVEAFNKKLEAGEIVDLGEGDEKVFAAFTDRTGRSVPTTRLDIGSTSWDESKIVGLGKGSDGKLWAVVKEGNAEVSRPVTHGWGANKESVEANIFGDVRELGSIKKINRGSLRNMRPSGKMGVTAGGKQNLKTIWDWFADLGGGSEPD